MEVAEPLGLTYLNLPLLPIDLENKIIEVAKNIPPDEDGRKWIENFHNNQIQAVSHVYGRDNTFLTDEIQTEINEIYSSYFGETVNGIVGNLSNTQQYNLACSPPHCDRYRYIAINYLLQAGGTNVQTCFYKQYRESDDTIVAANITYDKLEFDVSICVPEKKWHSYNVQYFHSVENIESTRLMFSLVIYSNPTPSQFKEKYAHLLI